MIEFQNVSVYHVEQDVLSEVSFQINPGERVGVLGPNGSGKSTIFAMITGDMTPNKGQITLGRNLRLGHLKQQLNAHLVGESVLAYACRAIPRLGELQEIIEKWENELSDPDAERELVLEKLGNAQTEFEDLGGYDIESRAAAALSGLGFSIDDFDKPFASFSGGWQMRAELARVLISDPDILLLDEPSNYLDLPAVEWIQRFLREYRGTLLMISHDRYLLASLTDCIMEVANTKVTRYQGGYAYYVREREGRRTQMVAAKRNQDRERAQVERFVERFRSKSTKAAQVQSRIKQLEKMEELPDVDDGPDLSRITIAPAPHCGDEVIRLEDVSHHYDESKELIGGLELSIKRGDRVALVGYNGMGKTTLLRVMAGVLEPTTGTRTLGYHVVVGYLSQEFSDTMSPNKTVYEIVRDRSNDGNEREIRAVLGLFGFSGSRVEKRCEVLSGGEKIRLAFARLFIDPPNLLLLDEPTTHLDMSGRQALEQALVEYDGTVCLVSHDVEFVRTAATSVVAIMPGQALSFPGGYDYFREKTGGLEALIGAPDKSAKKEGPKASRKDERRQRAEDRKSGLAVQKKLKKTISSAERKLDELGLERSALADVLSAGVPGTDYATVNARLSELQGVMDQLTGEWEVAVAELDRLTGDDA